MLSFGEPKMQRKTRIILLVIAGVIVVGILAVLILFVIFANLIATPARRNVPAHLTKACSGRAISMSLMQGLFPAEVVRAADA